MTTKQIPSREGGVIAGTIDSLTASPNESQSRQERWSFKRIEDGHAILMSRDARLHYPRAFNADDVIEWEHGCTGKQAKSACARVRLIAAAPALLAALKWLMHPDGGVIGTEPVIEAALAAIALAEGHSASGPVSRR